jgi:phosphohistidine phosphatase
MRRLMLLRHAKSDWSAPGTRDQDRPLNTRGREAAPRMGR